MHKLYCVRILDVTKIEFHKKIDQIEFLTVEPMFWNAV